MIIAYEDGEAGPLRCRIRGGFNGTTYTQYWSCLHDRFVTCDEHQLLCLRCFIFRRLMVAAALRPNVLLLLLPFVHTIGLQSFMRRGEAW
jgi:hypothetical protein